MYGWEREPSNIFSSGSGWQMASRTIRTSINTFLQGYHSFTSIAVLLAFPASASILLCQALAPSSGALLQIISFRLRSLFQAANFPASEFFFLLNCKLTQTIYSCFFTLPFTLTFLPLAKVCAIYIFHEIHRRRLGIPPLPSFLLLYRPVLLTHLLNSFVILSANANVFVLTFLAFNAAGILGGPSSRNNVLTLSAAGALLYSIAIAYSSVVCNLAIVVASTENRSGYVPILKACLLLRGRVMTALGLALPTNLGLAAVEALFQYRVVRQYNLSGKLSSSILWEAFSITYFHVILLVLEVIVNCVLYNSCTIKHRPDSENQFHHQEEMESEDKGSLCVQLLEAI